jgi:hypothetical protein
MDHSMTLGEYNRDQLMSFEALRDACSGMLDAHLQLLVERLQPYLAFRRELEDFHARYFRECCRQTCFQTGLSACCGFESIITFFADQAITWLISGEHQRQALFRVLQRPNRSGKCVFLGDNGCIWRVPPVSCALFLCDSAKAAVFGEHPEAAPVWEELRGREKAFTHPSRLVLFDELERVFLELGARSPHMFFHTSPGLLRFKAKAGILDEAWCRSRKR